ncbi:uncharacterized protein UV8b_06912 [Ustilaginoidea virens]|uniref:Uncharacterized protein n=1 Tax=Ustilaginoidea virens TaxID=1159556 RepID=A0A8E5MKA7_USTVR|nr:uncharacterized protein UV8b_06912 [Ustilaginoidea virens]QUC22671.1 hypothetical protein UV8b_06912 [Ustilaginoidea virens]
MKGKLYLASQVADTSVPAALSPFSHVPTTFAAECPGRNARLPLDGAYMGPYMIGAATEEASTCCRCCVPVVPVTLWCFWQGTRALPFARRHRLPPPAVNAAPHRVNNCHELVRTEDDRKSPEPPSRHALVALAPAHPGPSCLASSPRSKPARGMATEQSTNLRILMLPQAFETGVPVFCSFRTPNKGNPSLHFAALPTFHDRDSRASRSAVV